MEPPKKIELKMDEEKSTGEYSNIVNVIHNRSEFIIDFARMMPGVKFAKIVSRVILSPANIKAFSRALAHNLEEYEKKFGTIELGEKQEEKRIGF